MQSRPDQSVPDNPLRNLTPDQFMALGGNAVVYVKAIRGAKLSGLMDEPDLDDNAEFQIVVSADGSTLLVADSREAVEDWLSDRDLGVAALH
ncbi:MAG: DUF1150 family protein [Devosia sp.]